MKSKYVHDIDVFQELDVFSFVNGLYYWENILITYAL